MRLLIDMNLSPRWLALLAEGGFQAVHWSAIGRHNAPDREIMADAAEHDFVVLTHDLDFGAILAATQGLKPSVVQIRAEDVGTAAIGSQVIGRASTDGSRTDCFCTAHDRHRSHSASGVAVAGQPVTG